MKVYEYLAAGLPVVATSLPAIAGVDGDRDRRRRTDHGARRSIARWPTTRRPRAPRARPPRAAHSWDARLAEIGDAITAAEAQR